MMGGRTVILISHAYPPCAGGPDRGAGKGGIVEQGTHAGLVGACGYLCGVVPETSCSRGAGSHLRPRVPQSDASRCILVTQTRKSCYTEDTTGHEKITLEVYRRGN